MKSSVDESLIQNAQLVCTIDDEILYCVKDLQQKLHCLQLSPQQIMVEYSGKRGRPRFQIYFDQLRFLLILNFSVTDIAKIFAVSLRTVHRKMSGCLLSVSNSYSTLTGQELNAILRDILIDFPKTGYRRILGHLNASGMRVQEKPVEEKFSQGRFRRCH